MMFRFVCLVLELAFLGYGRRTQTMHELRPLILARAVDTQPALLNRPAKQQMPPIVARSDEIVQAFNGRSKLTGAPGVKHDDLQVRTSTVKMSLASLEPPQAVAALFATCTIPLLPTLANNPTWVFSVGYGLSAATAGIALLASHGSFTGDVATWVALGLVAYGIRLAGFLYWRQNNWAEWKKRAMESPEAKAKNLLLPVLSCGAFYCLMCSPAMWMLRQGTDAAYLGIAIVGVILQWTGLLIEGIADYQKSSHKSKQPNTWCSSGLFSVVRHPNYLGEILHWAGVFIAGIPAMALGHGEAAEIAGRLLPAFLGFIGIFGLMTSVTPKLDAKQADKYGKEEGYADYVSSTKMLVPGAY